MLSGHAQRFPTLRQTTRPSRLAGQVGTLKPNTKEWAVLSRGSCRRQDPLTREAQILTQVEASASHWRPTNYAQLEVEPQEQEVLQVDEVLQEQQEVVLQAQEVVLQQLARSSESSFRSMTSKVSTSRSAISSRVRVSITIVSFRRFKFGFADS